MTRCFVSGCPNGRTASKFKSGVSFHKIPKAFQKQWLRAIGKDDIVTEVFLDYNNEPDDVIRNLIEFCVNVAGFQNVDVHKYFRLSQFTESFEKFFKFLESHETLKKNNLLDGKYLLGEKNTNLIKTLKIGIYNFLQKLIKYTHLREILYKKNNFSIFFKFIKCMITSDARNIKHTGVIFGVKILTALVLVFNDVINDPDFVMDESESTKRPKSAQLAKQKQDLDNFINFFYFIFVNNCRLQCPKLYQMRAECIYEAKIWMKYFPKLFISDYQTIHYIMKLIVDVSKEVRMAALCACEDLFSRPSAVNFLRPISKELTEAIGGRFYDVDVQVSVKAINIFTIFLKIDENLISANRCKNIGNLVFDEYAPIGIAASTFFTSYFEIKAKSPIDVLLDIVRLYRNKVEGDCIKELIVEGFLHVCNIMQNWTLFCKLILEDINSNIKEALAEIFSESFYQSINGKSDKTRSMSKDNIVDLSLHEELAKTFPLLTKILSETSNPKVLLEILRIIGLVNYSHLERNYCTEYIDIANVLYKLFYYHVDESLIKKSAEVLFGFLKVPDLAIRVDLVCKKVCKEAVAEYLEYLNKPNEKEIFVPKRIAILYEYYNFNDVLYEKLLVGIGSVNDQANLDLLTCCKWSIIWELKLTVNITHQRQQQLDKVFYEMRQRCNMFSEQMFNILQNAQLNQKFLIEAYTNICHFYCTFNKELENLKTINKTFTNLQLEIKDQRFRKVLLIFLQTNVICNKNMSLIERRTHVVKYVDLTFIGILPIDDLTNIFKYYYSYNKEFGPIIYQCVESLAKTCIDSTVWWLIIYTLQNVYLDLLAKHSVVDIRTDEANHLRALAKLFSTLKCLNKSDNNELVLSLSLLLKFGTKNESRLPFLFVIKPFLGFINDAGVHKKIQHFFKTLIPKSLEKNEAVLFFGNFLKNLEIKKVPMTPKKSAKPSEEQTPAKKKKPFLIEDKENLPISDSMPSTSKTPGTQKSKTPRSLKSKTPRSRKSKTTKSKLTDTETELYSEDDMTIHDSESDMETGVSNMSIHDKESDMEIGASNMSTHDKENDMEMGVSPLDS